MILPLLLPIHTATVAVTFYFFLTSTYMSFSFYFTDSSFLFSFFFLYKLLRHRDIQVSLRLTQFRPDASHLRLSLVQFTSRKFVSFIQIVKIIIINATKTHTSTLRRARLCVTKREMHQEVPRGSFYNILVMQ